ncbi:MAG TPA: hypothetical protein VMG58_15930 [Candidatus Sulfotelmatobacter sp.]|nr:hypothetical protein [Candidatus Sulfotelmatobacter sp.]
MMRKLLSLLVALGFLLGAAGTVLADCGGTHTDTVTNPPAKPLPRV